VSKVSCAGVLLVVAALVHPSCTATTLPMRRFQAYEGPLKPAAETARLCGDVSAIDGERTRLVPSPQQYVPCLDVLPGKHAVTVEYRQTSRPYPSTTEAEWTAAAGKTYHVRLELSEVVGARTRPDGTLGTAEVTCKAFIEELPQAPPVLEATEEVGGASRYEPAPSPRGESATLYVYRYRAYPLKRSPDIFVDGVEVPVPEENTYTWIHLRAGERQLRIKWSFDIPKPAAEFPLTFVANHSYYIRISDGPTLQPATQPRQPLPVPRVRSLGNGLDLVEPADAEAELRHCCGYGGPKIPALLPPPRPRP
jgi:hypothetical protein